MGISTFDPAAQVQGKRSAGASLFASSATFASFSYHFISFFASNCLRISLLTILLEGFLSYNLLYSNLCSTFTKRSSRELVTLSTLSSRIVTS